MTHPTLSVLDLAPIVQGATAADALRNTLDLARHAEQLGYHRYWLAEHHNMPGIASSATAVVIAHIAGGTSRIRVGAGGVMLPNHAPLVIAEQFGTLESLFPGRIDLGLGRAPGTDARTMVALRRDPSAADSFPEDVVELLSYFGDVPAGQRVRAVPGMGLRVPVWLLGSSLFSAQLAAAMGLPFAFASHFAPEYLLHALAAYRSTFTASSTLSQPYAMAGVAIIAAEDDDTALHLATSMQQQSLALIRGRPGQLPPPVDDMGALWSPQEEAAVRHRMRYAIVGGPDTVRRGLAAFIEETGVDEVMVVAQIFDHVARRRSYEIVMDATHGTSGERWIDTR